jgi:predicted DsbA family dithiol-disulfide isomerase
MKRIKLTESQLKMLQSLDSQDIAKELANKINSSINEIDESMSYNDFADAIAIVLQEQYGKHNFSSFLERLQSKL